MKPLIISALIGLSLFAATFCADAQEWRWRWAAQNYGYSKYNLSSILTTDLENNIFTGITYCDSLFIDDTVFFHPGYEGYTRHQLIAKYDRKGDCKGYIDLRGPILDGLWSVTAVTDAEGYVYVGGDFCDSLYIEDTTILPLPHQGFVFSNVFLAKFSPDLRLQWVKLIGGDTQNRLLGLKANGNSIYLTCEHMANGNMPFNAYILGQDTVHSIKPVCSMMQVDTGANISWITHIENSGFNLRNFLQGGDGRLYVTGHTNYYPANIIVGNDTIQCPANSMYHSLPFLIGLNTDGSFYKGWIKDWDVYTLQTVVDEDGAFIFTANISDSITVGGVTVTNSGDSIASAVVKINNEQEPEWIRTFRSPHIQINHDLLITLSNNQLFFGISFQNRLKTGDTTFHIDYWYENLVGRLEDNGMLAGTILSNTDYHSRMTGIGTDNCGNIIITGWFIGNGIYGNDTITSRQSWSTNDLFIGYLDLNEYAFDLGPDTISCHDYTISGPAGWVRYYWNGTLTPGKDFYTTQSGMYRLTVVSAGNCWQSDSVHVTIQQPPVFNIGPDTTIKRSHILTLSMPEGFGRYLWSNGDTTSTITFPGNHFASGQYTIWGEVTEELCSVRDSMNLSVINDIGINESAGTGFMLYPNPATSVLGVEVSTDFSSDEGVLTILNATGKMQLECYLNGNKKQIDISTLPPGLYFVRLSNEKTVEVGKFVKE